MKWVTRRDVHLDRVACAWLIQRFIDPAAEFSFVASGVVPGPEQGTPFDMRGVRLGHHEGLCTFEVILREYGLTGDSGLLEMARAVHGADIPMDADVSPVSPGLDALARGFMLLEPDDRCRIELQMPVYDALYAFFAAKSGGPDAGPARAGAPGQ